MKGMVKMKCKKLIGVILCISLVLMSAVFPAYAQDLQNITVTVTASMYGDLIEGATLVNVELDGKESYNLNDVFSKFHSLYYDGEDGYSFESGDYGDYITGFWGDESGNFVYQLTGGEKYAGGLDTLVEDGDYIDVTIYENRYPDTEVYTKFDTYKKEVQAGEEFEIVLYQAGYDENWNTVFSPCEGATVVCDKDEYITDSDGKAVLHIENCGTYIITAQKSKIVKEAEVCAITAPVCEITVKPGYSDIMDNIADIYSTETILSDGNMIWFLADMAVYDKVFPEKGKTLSEDVKNQCLEKIISNALSSSSSSNLAKSILALRALGYDAREVYGKDFKKTDLVAKLNGLIDEKSDSVTDIYTISYVLLALNQGEGYISDETRDYLLDEIIINKESWQENEWGTDAATAMLLALAPYYDENEEIKTVVDETLDIVKGAQSESGAIGNAASTGLAMVALSAFGIDPDEVITNEMSLTDALVNMASENYDGFEPMENSFSTEQGFRGILALELMKNDMGRMYDFSDSPMNLAWETVELSGCPVVFNTIPEKAKIEMSDATAFEKGKYDLSEGTYTYTVSAEGYKKHNGTITVSAEEAENHILKEIDVTLSKNQSGSGGGSSGGAKEEKNEDKKEKIDEKEDVSDAEANENETSDVKNFDENTFEDVKSSDWYYESVKYVYQNNLMQGTEKGFEPMSEMTRAMLVTVLFRMDSEKEETAKNVFGDVAEDSWYFDSVSWAAKNNIVSGVLENTFAPDESVTREQMAVIIYRYALYKGYDVKQGNAPLSYEDKDSISTWASDAVIWANNAGIINGTGDGKISPKDSATRSQVAAILMRFCKGIEK